MESLIALLCGGMAAAALLGAAIAFAAAQHWLVWADGSAALQTPFP